MTIIEPTESNGHAELAAWFDPNLDCYILDVTEADGPNATLAITKDEARVLVDALTGGV